MTYNEKLLHYQEKRNSGLAFIVISVILFIIGAIFFFLSYKYNVIRERVFVIGIEFFVSMISLSCFVIFLSLGLIFVFSSNKKLNDIKRRNKYKNEQANLK